MSPRAIEHEALSQRVVAVHLAVVKPMAACACERPYANKMVTG